MLLHKMKEYVMTTRRAFLRGVGAGLLLPATWDFLANHLEKYGEPFLSAPTPTDHTLYGIPLGEDFQLSLDTAEDEMPPAEMSIRDFIRECAGGEDHGYWHTDDYDQPIGDFFVWEIWPYQYSASARAFYFLYGLDLGTIDSSGETNIGYIDFVEGPAPGNDSRFVCVDALGASLLQHRLADMGYRIAVKLV